jgi:integrase
MVEFMAYTGVRAAEVSGLEVCDIVFAPNPDSNSLKATVQVRRTKHRKGGKWVTGTLKTKASRRAVPLPPWLATKMADYLSGTRRAGTPTTRLHR